MRHSVSTERQGKTASLWNRLAQKGVSIAFLVAAIFWLLEAAIDGFIFREGAFLAQIFPSDLDELRMRLSLAVLTIAFGAYVQAVFRHRASQAQVAEIEAHFGEVLQISANAIIMADAAYKIILFNPGAERVFAYQADEVMGQALTLILPELLSESHAKQLEIFSPENDPSIVDSDRLFDISGIFGRRKNGEEFPAEASVSKLARNGETIFTVIVRNISARVEAEATIRSLAYYDPITRLPNRTYFREHLKTILEESAKDRNFFALLLIDLDRFKEVNDTLGHQRGDILLREVGLRLQGLVDVSDLVARLGGDEFALLLSNANEGDARNVANKITSVLNKPFKLEGFPIPLESSLGIALYPDHGTDAELLLQHADVAMYEAKRKGVDYLVYSSEKDKHTVRRLALMGALRNAIKGDELCLYYQPKIKLGSRAIFDVEALVRWEHPEEGILEPEQFIPPAEHTGLIKPLTEWVLREAVYQCSLWHRQGLKIGIAVNLSARSMHDVHLPDLIIDVLESYAFSPVFLELEVTESAIMADAAHAQIILKKLREIGVSIAIDDFGVGYSSFSYLKNLSVDVIKIDKSFTRNMVVNSNDAAIVRSIIELGHNLGLNVIAEGVENQTTWDALLEIGCDAAQGFFMTPPLSSANCMQWLQEGAPERGWHV
ncbi:diguanylate cyclase/phosphodiesterase (GGDEF & EAL domains) with PAS/PAC sensor(s) [hydrothermal vent metagenome]|uniref:Diguanylate cyclase/phosphodiesterase (GGDEF & EAL domains) with PAS/PAC sensor(S) n=1 Tax=hydrothermal vent metagenome TaxID=652676 RepID=A0A3B1D8T3_9ZZZZ